MCMYNNALSSYVDKAGLSYTSLHLVTLHLLLSLLIQIKINSRRLLVLFCYEVIKL